MTAQTGALLVVVLLMFPLVGLWHLAKRWPWAAVIVVLLAAAGILAKALSR